MKRSYCMMWCLCSFATCVNGIAGCFPCIHISLFYCQPLLSIICMLWCFTSCLFDWWQQLVDCDGFFYCMQPKDPVYYRVGTPEQGFPGLGGYEKQRQEQSIIRQKEYNDLLRKVPLDVDGTVWLPTLETCVLPTS